jgi:hypothetical protein
MHTNRNNTHIILYICNHCGEGVVARVLCMHTGSLTSERGDISRNPNITIQAIYPETPKCDAPEYVPKNISQFYKEGFESLRRQNYNAAGMMFRKVLDIATKDIGGTKTNLFHRIEELADKHIITPDMKEWAHEIREIGNDAAHDSGSLPHGEAEDLKNFTELLLQYIYTLPETLRLRREAGSTPAVAP